MSKVVQLKNGIVLRLEEKAFAGGGEGDLFKILSPVSFQKQVIKIYKVEKRTKEREQKIDYLVANPPKILAQGEHHSVIWPDEVIYENGKFVGFLMPIAKGEKLELLCHPKLPTTLQADWHKFDFKNQKSVELRLTLCFNIAVALYHIHVTGTYVLVDMKPDNIMVQPNGLISIIDIDSTAVVRNNRVIFAAPVVTAEYTPPEYYRGVKPDKEGVFETWDRFSLSVIFYRLLCGIHPFIGTCTTPYDKCDGTAQMIENGLFPFSSKSSFFKVIPPPHNNFRKLEHELQQLFKKCFNDGHSNPTSRPSADEWCGRLSPQQAIQISRPLPSSSISFPSYVFSNGIAYSNPITSVTFPTVSYMKPLSEKGMKALFAIIIGKSAQQKLEETIRKSENDLRLRYSKQAVFEKELGEILATFKSKEKLIFEQEREAVAELKNHFIAQAGNIDNEARDLYIQEALENKIAYGTLSNLISSIEKKVGQLYSEILGDRFRNHENQKNIAQSKIDDLLNRQKNELTSLTNDPNKLVKYRIETAPLHNFGSATIQSVFATGIRTAADFTSISSDGCLRNRQGKWVKANGVGWSRAYILNEWRNKCELEENRLLSNSVQRKYKNEFLGLNQTLESMEAIFQKSIEPFQNEYNKRKSKLDEEKKEQGLINEKRLLEIKSKYNHLHELLISKAKIIEKSMIQRLKEVTEEIDKCLKGNLKSQTSLFMSKTKEVNEFKSLLNVEIDALYNLHAELTELREVRLQRK